MKIINEYGSLVKSIKERLNIFGTKPIIVAIDGGTGVGKSKIAHDLWNKLGGGIIHGDNYKLATIDYKYKPLPKYLKQELDRLLKIHSQIIIIESILLWQILNEISIKPDLTIYIKKFSNSIWSDKSELENYAADQRISSLRKQIIDYHKKDKPLKKADIIYCNIWK